MKRQTLKHRLLKRCEKTCYPSLCKLHKMSRSICSFLIVYGVDYVIPLVRPLLQIQNFLARKHCHKHIDTMHINTMYSDPLDISQTANTNKVLVTSTNENIAINSELPVLLTHG